MNIDQRSVMDILVYQSITGDLLGATPRVATAGGANAC